MLASFRSVAVLTAALTVVFAGSGWVFEGVDSARLPQELALIAANTLPLLAVRRNPLLVAVAFSIAYPTWVALGHPIHELQSLPCIAGMYALGAWRRPLWLRSLGLLMPVWMITGGTFLFDGEFLELTFIGVFLVVMWGLGALIADRRDYASALETRTRELEQAREELAEQAVADERSRVARELHDVIAHAMSVITVQAGVANHLIDRRPAQAAESLGVIERTGREALQEMRRMLAVLRDRDPDAPLPDPQPTLRDIPSLVEQARQAGIEVTYTTRGSSGEAPAGLGLAVYRVVQEALTNVVKHAPGSSATVTVTHRPGQIEVEVANTLPRAAARVPPAEPPESRTGHGLRGMTERVELYGGQLETTADADAFRVVARVPLSQERR